MSAYIRQKIMMIREELLTLKETNLIAFNKEVSCEDGNRDANFCDMKKEVVCIDDENRSIIDCINVNKEFVSPLISVEINDEDKMFPTESSFKSNLDNNDNMQYGLHLFVNMENPEVHQYLTE